MTTPFLCRKRLSSYLLATLLLLPLAGFLQADEGARTPRLFETDEILSITLTAPWQDLETNREYQGTYPATIEYTGPDGREYTHDLTVERRGIKRQETCRIPPVKLRFEKDAVKDTVFHGQKSLKLVTHCQNSDRYDQYYLLEMMAYRIYNLFNDYSFRVRPLSVTYRDSQEDDVDEDRFGFVIEDDSDVAKRNGLKKLEIPKIMPSRLDKETSSEFALFQLMIGNLDWSPLIGPDPAECCHNVKLVAPRPFEDGDLAWPVPYDFDTSGFVDAPYASPPAGLGINSVTKRVYRGYCAHNGTLQATRQKIIGLEAEIFGVLASDPRLSERSAKKAGRFLEKYFDLLRDDGDFERLVVRKCRK